MCGSVCCGLHLFSRSGVLVTLGSPGNQAMQSGPHFKMPFAQKIVTAQAEADANRIRSESITNEILTSNAIAKWDGKLPAVMSDTNSILDVAPMIGQ